MVLHNIAIRLRKPMDVDGIGQEDLLFLINKEEEEEEEEEDTAPDEDDIAQREFYRRA